MSTIYVKGDAVTNATSYELFEKASDGTYTSLGTNTEINFEVSALGLAAGDHVLAVKAHADGYDSSDFSNEVTYSVDEADAEWEIYSADSAATVTSEDGVPTVACTSGKAVIAMLKTNKNFSFTAPRGYGSDGGKMIVIGKYSTNVLAIRVRGSGTGTMLQRYGYESFSGAALSTDSSAVNTFAAGDTLKVTWSGNTVSLYVNDTLQSSFDCSTYTADESWAKYAGWLETAAGSSSITLSDFTVIS